MMEKILEDVFCFKDTCNVYILKRGTEAVLIDFGSGEVLKNLEAIGVSRITDILMTHHHRDQGQGLRLAEQLGIRIWVPHTEQDLFHRVDQHWQSREITNNYNVRQDRFSLLESVAIYHTLKDYQSYRFADLLINVIPTPGHTVGSLSFLVQVEEKKVLFSGDLLYEQGKVWSMSALQWTYNGAEGVAYSILSLHSVQNLAVDLLLPSHGGVIKDPRVSIQLLLGRFRQILQIRGQYGHLQEWIEKPYEEITPHLLRNKTCFAHSYVLLSESGNALIIDYGYDFNLGLAAGADRSSRRPWLYTLDYLKKTYGVKKIDVVMPTHYHDDHVAGFNLLREIEGSQVWAASNFSDLLQNPEKYDLPCLWYDPILVDRQLPLDEPIAWEEYKFQLYEQPGHTLYAVAISFQVDGYHVLAVGDQQDNSGQLWNYVYKNRFRINDYEQSAALYAQLKPDLILSGHWEPLWVKQDWLLTLKENGMKLKQLHEELLPLSFLNFDAEGCCAWIRPYQLHANAGEIVQLEVEVLNPLDDQETLMIQLVLPLDWEQVGEKKELPLGANQRGKISFHLSIPERIKTNRARVAVDLSTKYVRLGQQAEALITIE